ncbi:hypothetical protein BDV96DRAFT_655375 [Lophiotrema nucula]|uniref:Uncharacterized protein n=1 Tax=Lophiotrema nucula TaxID=690887 RepID=A0A6A5YF72_9PLEO|nr:hypothetical protein BDV96DRAFT_655375 [Lophiotrema nucula]
MARVRAKPKPLFDITPAQITPSQCITAKSLHGNPRETCEVWDAVWCHEHEGVPKQTSRKNCDLCKALLCSTYYRRANASSRKSCDECKEKNDRGNSKRPKKKKKEENPQERGDVRKRLNARDARNSRNNVDDVPSPTQEPTLEARQIEALQGLREEVNERLSSPETLLGRDWQKLPSVLPQDSKDWIATPSHFPILTSTPTEYSCRVHVLETTDEDLQKHWDEDDRAFNKYGCIVLQKSLRSPEASAKTVVEALSCAHRDGQADVQVYNDRGCPNTNNLV